MSSPQTITNKYFDLATGPLDVEASSIINGIAAEDGMSLGEVVGLAPIGGGITQTPVGSLLPRFERTVASVDPGFGVIVGGDLDGVYANGLVPVNSAGIPLESIVVNRGNGIRVCTQGRCLAQVDGQSNGPIVPGDSLTANNGIYTAKAATGGTATKARALQATTVNNSIIAVDIQREDGPDVILGKRRLITIASNNVPTTVPGPFHALVSFKIEAIGTVSSGSGSPEGFDFFFTKADGTTRIPYEREFWDESTGEMRAWVKLESLNAIQDNTFFMYYGGASDNDQQNKQGVWGSEYEQVFHFAESNPLPWINSVDAGFGNIDQTFGTLTLPLSIAGQIKNGTTLNSKSSVLQSTFKNLPTTSYTMIAWIKKTNNGTGNASLLYVFTAAKNPNVNFIQILSGVGAAINNTSISIVSGGFSITEQIGTITDNNYHMVAVTIDSQKTVRVNFDNVNETDFVINAFPDIGSLAIGNTTATGTIAAQAGVDEVRVSSQNLGEPYKQNSFLNQTNNASGVGQGDGGFISVGAQQDP